MMYIYEHKPDIIGRNLKLAYYVWLYIGWDEHKIERIVKKKKYLASTSLML